MAVRLARSRTLILTPAKTGSTWLRQALTAAGVEWSEEGPPESQGQGGLEVHARAHEFVAAFVRHPVNWYMSYWSYRMEGGWRERFHLDRTCRANDFTQFVRLVASNVPGFLGAMFERFCGPPEAPVEFIGRQERLAQDLATLLELRDEPFHEEALWSHPRANATSLKPQLTDDIEDLICVVEQPLLDRFGYEWEDRLGLREAQRDWPAHAPQLQRLALWTERIHWAHDDAKHTNRRAIDTVRNARCRSNFALYAYLVLEDAVVAAKWFDEALRLAPQHPRTLSNYAAVMADAFGDDASAEQLFRRALASRPGHIHSLELYTRFLAARSRHGEASVHRNTLRALASEAEAIMAAKSFLFSPSRAI